MAPRGIALAPAWRTGLLSGHDSRKARHHGSENLRVAAEALPGRTNIVITRDPEFTAPERVWVVRSLEEALARGQEKAREDGVAEVMVIGGATIYEACLPLADRLYLTEIHGAPEGDTFFHAFLGAFSRTPAPAPLVKAMIASPIPSFISPVATRSQEAPREGQLAPGPRASRRQSRRRVALTSTAGG